MHICILGTATSKQLEAMLALNRRYTVTFDGRRVSDVICACEESGEVFLAERDYRTRSELAPNGELIFDEGGGLKVLPAMRGVVVITDSRKDAGGVSSLGIPFHYDKRHSEWGKKNPHWDFPITFLRRAAYSQSTGYTTVDLLEHPDNSDAVILRLDGNTEEGQWQVIFSHWEGDYLTIILRDLLGGNTAPFSVVALHLLR